MRRTRAYWFIWIYIACYNGSFLNRVSVACRSDLESCLSLVFNGKKVVYWFWLKMRVTWSIKWIVACFSVYTIYDLGNCTSTYNAHVAGLGGRLVLSHAELHAVTTIHNLWWAACDGASTVIHPLLSSIIRLENKKGFRLEIHRKATPHFWEGRFSRL
jgi:hypothetical protein